MQSEAEELARLLSMASTVAVLFERCQDLEQHPEGRSPRGPLADPRDMHLGFGALSAVQSAATGVARVQRNVLRQLIESSLGVSQHLGAAASLVLDELERDPESSATRGTGNRQAGMSRVIHFPGEPQGYVDEENPEVEAAEPQALIFEKPRIEQRALAVPAVPEPVPEFEPAGPSTPKRPLDGWVRALAGYYSHLLPDALAPSTPASRIQAMDGFGSASLLRETRVTVSGSTLSELMGLHQALASIDGVRDVTPIHITSDSALLRVKHDLGDALGDRMTTALGQEFRLGPAGPGFLSVDRIPALSVR